MFDKEKFATVLKKINETYDNQTYFAIASGVNRTYLSQYMNMKLDSPPSPKILKGISKASKGIITYEELMNICGHIKTSITNSLSDASCFVQIPLFNSLKELITYDNNIENAPHNFYTSIYIKDNANDYFAFTAFDNSMSPLLDTGDIAIIHKQDYYENGQIHLILLEDNILLIRKIIELDNKLELHSTNPYCPIIKLTKEEMKKKNFTVLGKVVTSVTKSAFQ